MSSIIFIIKIRVVSYTKSVRDTGTLMTDLKSASSN